MTPSATSESEAVAAEPGTSEEVVGQQGEYRVIFRAMEVPGLPEDIAIGGVRISQTVGPVWTQRTSIRQNPGWKPVYDKKMQRIPVGDGEWLTTCVLPVTLPGDLSRAVEAWHDEVLTAVAILVAMFDERLAQEAIADDIVIYDEAGEPVTGADRMMLVREFPPANRVLQRHRDALAEFESLDLSQPSATLAGARWYLRAAQAGPTPDAIVFLWVALEALSTPADQRERRKGTDVQWIESAVRDAGIDPDELDPSVGRLYGLRADVVHYGIEQPDLLREGFYMLEMLARLLIRHRLNLSVGWRLRPGESNLRTPFKQMAESAHRFRETRWQSSE
jgi:hypothetical protein